MNGDNPCARCTTSRCCTLFDPELTGPDIHRIVRDLGLPFADFVVPTPVRADLAGPDGLLLGAAETWELRLARTPQPRGEGDNRRCIFLMHIAPGVNRCGIYASRPMLCRTYPTDLTRFGLMVGNPTEVCPPDSWAQERADLAHFAAIHRLAEPERQRWRAFVARWNSPDLQGHIANWPREAVLLRLLAAIHAMEDATAAGLEPASAIATALG